VRAGASRGRVRERSVGRSCEGKCAVLGEGREVQEGVVESL